MRHHPAQKPEEGTPFGRDNLEQKIQFYPGNGAAVLWGKHTEKWSGVLAMERGSYAMQVQPQSLYESHLPNSKTSTL